MLTRSRQEAVVDFQHQRAKSCVIKLTGTVTCAAIPCAIGLLVFQDFIAHHAVVMFPLFATAVHHRLGFVVVGVEIAVWCAEFQLRVGFDVFGTLTNFRRRAFIPHLEAKHTDACERVVTTARSEGFLARVAETTVIVLFVFQIIKAFAGAAAEVFEIKTGVFHRLERLDVPAGDGNVRVRLGSFVVGIRPAPVVVLVIDEELARFLRGFGKIGNGDAELFAERGCFSEGVDADGVLIAPMLVAHVVCQFALVLHAYVDEVGHRL